MHAVMKNICLRQTKGFIAISDALCSIYSRIFELNIKLICHATEAHLTELLYSSALSFPKESSVIPCSHIKKSDAPSITLLRKPCTGAQVGPHRSPILRSEEKQDHDTNWYMYCQCTTQPGWMTSLGGKSCSDSAEQVFNLAGFGVQKKQNIQHTDISQTPVKNFEETLVHGHDMFYDHNSKAHQECLTQLADI